MPLKECSVDGQKGWKYGDEGHCYTGKDGKKKAIKQGVAIETKRGGKFHGAAIQAILEDSDATSDGA